jgi:hypothetical protein
MLSYKLYNQPGVESKKMLPVDVDGEKPRGARLPESVTDVSTKRIDRTRRS